MSFLFRLDVALVERELAETRSKAQAYIKKGVVRVNGSIAAKASLSVAEGDILEVLEKEKYVGRGGEKLEEALDHFKINVENVLALDIGASTGGFTDCLLQRGARKVFAVDAGHDQLAEKLKNDPRVESREGVNARFLSPEDFSEKFDLIVMDVSFISVEKVLPAVLPLGNKSCHLVILIKPQFEVGKENLGKGGIVKDESLRQNCVKKIEEFIQSQKNWTLTGTILSPILGDKGNVEYLLYARKNS